MGAYLSRPKTEKFSRDECNNTINCGASSMQGWRQTQEDAYNSILDYDENASLFAVYDGHGGNEVAEYTSQHFPNFLKGLDSYKQGNYEEALKEAFLKFDATLKEPEVMTTLKELAKSGNQQSDHNDSEDENLGNLKEEAQMPLEEVMAKYTANRECFVNSTVHALQKEGSKIAMPVSPYLRAKGLDPNVDKSCEKSSKDVEPCSNSSQANKMQEAEFEVSSSSSSKKIISPRKSLSEKYRNGKIGESSSGSEKVEGEQLNGKSEGESGVSDSQSDKVIVESDTNDEATIQLPDSSADLEKTDKAVVNGKDDHIEAEETKLDNALSSSVENGEVSDTGKGKGKALVKKSDKGKKEPMSAEKIFEGFVKLDQNEDCSESDSDDATFHGPDSTSDDDDEVEVAGEDEDEEDEDEDEDSEDYDEDGDDDEDEDEFTMNMTDEPGFDSGCTAVVALLLKNKIYVANAGDSRCIVSKNGEVIEMSFDHKPEDKIENERIKKAGGRVTCDGRVNGGLNLSRALGDHSYKRVDDLPPEEQMISPLPDIKVLEVDGDVEFMILACDGIWNYMSSQEVLDFVRPRLLKDPEKISKICEELFDHCLAPNTLGDGTGCDNMTAVLVQFKHSNSPSSKKRQADIAEAENCKRQKTDDSSSTSKTCDSSVSQGCSQTSTEKEN